MTETIRRATPEDLRAILSLYPYLNPGDPVPGNDARVTGAWKKIVADPDHYYLVAEDATMIVACCVLVIIPNLSRDATPYGLIENVVTHPDYRRQGISTRLLHHACETARERGCYKVMLLSGRKEAHPFYEHAGFDGFSKRGFVKRFDGR